MARTAFDPFEVLGVRRGATKDEVRAAYREQVARYHPDKHQGNPLEDLAAAKLIEINRAYEILSDDACRAAYEAATAERSQGSSGSVARHSPAMTLLRSVGGILGLLFFVRFGLALGARALLLLRGILLGLLSVFRMGPVFALVVVLGVMIGASYFLQSRKRR